ncbi:hypothetical protein T07_9531 [Trichinella nelsoni]|uniref:Uncharacterized protein n=1 Tax=Trichinella nelsoni TaxID=6336 RepID=A0A0V0RIG5_9BILA|nr:hypothetical protein T07_9531 [Trichinella nelsoni]
MITTNIMPQLCFTARKRAQLDLETDWMQQLARLLSTSITSSVPSRCTSVAEGPFSLVSSTSILFVEETKRKMKMLLVTSFLPVPQADTDVSLLEAGTAGSTLALFQ